MAIRQTRRTVLKAGSALAAASILPSGSYAQSEPLRLGVLSALTGAGGADGPRMLESMQLVAPEVDAVGADGVIQVRTQNQGTRVLLSVADNGCGMTEAFVRDSLFRPFQSTKKKGLGIGLFQCRAIVQAHGGGMQVESKVGEGTTFLVSLPVKDGQ